MLDHAFDRIRCEECGHEYLLVFLARVLSLPFLSLEAGREVLRMALRGSLKEGPPSPIGLQYSQDPSALFSL